MPFQLRYLLLIMLPLLGPGDVQAMHITEGIITGVPALVYTIAGLMLVGWGSHRMSAFARLHPDKKPLLGMGAALIFFISLIPLPAFTGTTSHPCGSPLVAVLLGPSVTIALTAISLLLQAAFFAHGGFSTWGANVVALGLAGAVVGWSVFRLLRLLRLPLVTAGIAAGLLGDVAVYSVSGLILAHTLSLSPTPQYSFTEYLQVIYAAYLPTQLPLALAEGLITGYALRRAYQQRPEVLADLGVWAR